MWLGLGSVHEVRKLHRVLDEKDGDVVANEIPVPLIRIELDREATDVPGGIGRAAFAEDGREAHEHRCLFSDFAKDRGAREFGDGLRAFEDAMRCRSARVHDALRYALVVEVSDLLAKDEVLEERRAPQAGLQRALVIGNRHALIGREHPAG